MKLQILNGAGSLIQAIVLKLIQFFPIYFLVFFAYGDRFLPSPANYWSYKVRTTVNNILVGSFETNLEDNFENSKFNNNRVNKIINDVEEENKN